MHGIRVNTRRHNVSVTPSPHVSALLLVKGDLLVLQCSLGLLGCPFLLVYRCICVPATFPFCPACRKPLPEIGIWAEPRTTGLGLCALGPGWELSIPS